MMLGPFRIDSGMSFNIDLKHRIYTNLPSGSRNLDVRRQCSRAPAIGLDASLGVGTTIWFNLVLNEVVSDELRLQSERRHHQGGWVLVG
jgi:hypothetical protein